MTSPLAGDRAVVSVAVGVAPAEAFRIFTEEIDQWWRHGMKYRFGRQRSVVHLECRPGGRLFESIGDAARARIVETGRIVVWEPPVRFVLAWRAGNFAPEETTEVEVTFAAQGEGTLVRLEHRGWSKIRLDHPVRHGQDIVMFLRRHGLWWGDQLSSLRELVEAEQSNGSG